VILPRHILPLSIALFAGCTRQRSLDEVPIYGASAEELAWIETELERFDRWTGGRVTLNAIEIETEVVDKRHAERETLGMYSQRRGVVYVESGLAESEFMEVLRHELCHALDFDIGARRDLKAPLQRVLDKAESQSHRYHWIHEDAEWSEEEKRQEILAMACEQGPNASALMATYCPSDSLHISVLSTALFGTVWLDSEVWPGGRYAEGNAYTEWLSGLAEDGRSYARGSASRSLASVYGSVSHEGEQVILDLENGGLSKEGFTDWNFGIEEPFALELPVGVTRPGPGRQGYAVQRQFWVEGDKVMILTRPEVIRGVMSQRPMVSADGGGSWEVLDTCVSDLGNVVLANEQIYAIDVDPVAGEVSWFSAP
jgi:hypothetical protein